MKMKVVCIRCTGLRDFGGGRNRGGARFQIQPWDPKTPYIAAMKAVAPDKAYNVYLAQRDSYAASPAFYFDCAEHLLSVGQRAQGIRVLGDVLELKLDDARLIRIVAHRLQQLDELDLAIGLFEKVTRLRGEEPQNSRAYSRFIYIHGTPEERNIGLPVSYGCIRMRSRDVIELFDIVGTGARVRIETQPLESLVPGITPVADRFVSTHNFAPSQIR